LKVFVIKYYNFCNSINLDLLHSILFLLQGVDLRLHLLQGE
jgi:hypothetical protein